MSVSLGRPMTTTPRLSIGLPVYNGEDYLAEALDALLGQTFEDFELIISDNASTDGTADICRRYEKQDSRIRYIRQPHNIGSSPNHNFVVQQARADLFKWAAADDLYAPELLQRCVSALDDDPRIVLAHSYTAAIDGSGQITQALKYPLATDSPSAPERFRSILFGASGLFDGDGGLVRTDNDGVIRSDDQYGVIRTSVLRQVAPVGSYYHADRVLILDLALQGPFHQAPDWLYFRRDHPDRATHAPSVRRICTILDPRRADRRRHPAARLYGEYFAAHAAAIQRAPLSSADKRACYRQLASWIFDRGTNRIFPRRASEPAGPASAGLGHTVAPPSVAVHQKGQAL